MPFSGGSDRSCRKLTWKGARYRIRSSLEDCIVSEIRRQREVLERYIEGRPEFASSLEPLREDPNAPDIVRRMIAASTRVGVGPMAAVAGAIAEVAARSALDRGAEEAIVENGGDIFLASNRMIRVGLYAGCNSVSDRLALRIEPRAMPMAVCSSSSLMGHSLSLGQCDLATVVAEDAALADAAATRACNLVRREEDVASALERIIDVPGIRGVIIVKAERIGMAGDLPELVRRSPNGGQKHRATE